MDIHFIWRLVGTLIFMLAAAFLGSFLSHFSMRVFFFEIYEIYSTVNVNWIHIDSYFIWQLVI